MNRRPIFICFTFLIAVLSTLVYFHYRTPPGITPQSDNAEILVWISLITAIVSLITTLIGLFQKFLELRKKGD